MNYPTQHIVTWGVVSAGLVCGVHPTQDPGDVGAGCARSLLTNDDWRDGRGFDGSDRCVGQRGNVRTHRTSPIRVDLSLYYTTLCTKNQYPARSGAMTRFVVVDIS